MTRQVRLLGPPRIEDEGQPCPPPRGLKSWAVLARVALAGRLVGRRELAGELFGEADDPLGALRWSLADLRRSLGLPSLLCGDPLGLAAGELWVDVRALEDGSLPVEEMGADLLEGIELRNCPGFDTWLLLARLDCAARVRQELRRRALSLLAAGEAAAAMTPAGRAATMDPLDEGAQELFLRVLVAAGRGGLASAHLASCEALFAREGLVPSPALRSAARDPELAPRPRLRAGVIAASLLRAGTAALDAGAVDAGVEPAADERVGAVAAEAGLEELVQPRPGGHRGVADRVSTPTTRPAGDTAAASSSRIPAGPQPRSIAPCPGLSSISLSSAAASGRSSSAWRCSRVLSSSLLPSAYTEVALGGPLPPARGAVMVISPPHGKRPCPVLRLSSRDR